MEKVEPVITAVGFRTMMGKNWTPLDLGYISISEHE